MPAALRATPPVDPPHALPAHAAGAGEPCVSCGRPADTPFCPHCGERRAADRPRAMSAIVEEVLETFSPFDGRIGRTAVSLVARPGELADAYVRGVRVPFVPPLRLFLAVNALYFFGAAATHASTFDTPLRTHTTWTPHRALATRLVAARLAATREPPDRFARRFDATSTTQAKSLVIVMVPAFALLLAAAQWRRRRPALQHLAVALHAYAVLLLLVLAVGLALGPLVRAWARAGGPTTQQGVDDVASLVLALAIGSWLAVALRRAYGDGRVAAAAKGVALVLGMGGILAGYRLLLFFTTLWAV